MSTKKYVFLLSVLLIITTTGISSSSDVHLSMENMKYEPTPAEAGGYFDIWIKVENLATEKYAENVTCELITDYPFSLDDNQPYSNLLGEESRSRNIGILPPRDQIRLQYRIRVEQDAVDGWNTLRIRCKDEKGDLGWIYQDMAVNVDEGVNLNVGSMRTEPFDMKADTNDLKLEVTLENNGGTNANSVNAYLEVPDGFEQSQSYSLQDSVGRIEEGDAKTAVFYLDVDEGVDSGLHKANLSVEYHSNNNDVVEDYEIDLDVRPTPNFEVRDIGVTPENLGQGDEDVELRFKVKNHGDDAESVSARMFTDSDQDIDFEENYDYVGNLDSNETGEAVFKFDVEEDADIKDYILDLEIRYVDGNDVKIDSESVRISVEEERRIMINELLLYILPLIGVIFLVYWFGFSEKQEIDGGE